MRSLRAAARRSRDWPPRRSISSHLPFPAFQVLARGVNDLVPVLPLLVALLVVERSPFWAGVLVGLSIAAKLMPGLAALPCLVPARGGRVHFAAGVVIGLVPIVPFAAAAPDAFFDNIVLFNLVRPIDDTSWLWGMPAFRRVGSARLRAPGSCRWRSRHRSGSTRPALPERCAAVVLAILLVFAARARHASQLLSLVHSVPGGACRTRRGSEEKAPDELDRRPACPGPARSGLARAPRTFAGRIKALLPRGLFGRSVLLLAAPLILSQVVGTWVFYDRFWVTIMRRNADAATSDIALVVESRHSLLTGDARTVLALRSSARPATA